MSLRDKQIREVLDENVKYYNEALKRQFQQVRLMDESYAPPNRLEKKIAFDIDKYFIEMTKIIDGMISDYTNTEKFNIKDISNLTSTYDTLIAFLSRYASTHPLNQRDLSAIEDKFDSLLPKISQLIDIASSNNLPDTNKLNALYNLIESRDYISLEGNTEEVKGRTRMLVDRQQAPINNPYYEPQPYAPPIAYASVKLRPYKEIMRDKTENNIDAIREEESQHQGEWNFPEEEEDYPKSIRESYRKEYERLDKLFQKSYDAYGKSETEENLKRLRFDWRKKQDLLDKIDKIERERQQPQPERQQPQPEREQQQQRERPRNDAELKKYINRIPEAELKELIDNMPHIKERLSKIKKGSVYTKLNKNMSLAQDIYTAREEGVRPTEYNETRGRRRTPAKEKEREQQQREQSAFPFSETEVEYGSEFSPMTSEAEGDGRTSFVKTKSGRFQMRGKGESEDKMFGLPYGFKKALDLRPMDRRPIIHYNGLNLDTTLEERMEFLNQLDSHRVSDKEFKLNSIKNMSEMKDRKYKKK